MVSATHTSAASVSVVQRVCKSVMSEQMSNVLEEGFVVSYVLGASDL